MLVGVQKLLLENGRVMDTSFITTSIQRLPFFIYCHDFYVI